MLRDASGDGGYPDLSGPFRPSLNARLRFFGLLAMLVPLFVGFRYLVLEAVPRVEIRIVSQEVPASAPVVVRADAPTERVVERVVYVPVERLEGAAHEDGPPLVKSPSAAPPMVAKITNETDTPPPVVVDASTVSPSAGATANPADAEADGSAELAQSARPAGLQMLGSVSAPPAAIPQVVTVARISEEVLEDEVDDEHEEDETIAGDTELSDDDERAADSDVVEDEHVAESDDVIEDDEVAVVVQTTMESDDGAQVIMYTLTRPKLDAPVVAHDDPEPTAGPRVDTPSDDTDDANDDGTDEEQADDEAQ